MVQKGNLAQFEKEEGVIIIVVFDIFWCSWTPKGQLVAHIHDHLQAVNKYVNFVLGSHAKILLVWLFDIYLASII